ncbi:hypothetical protein AAFF_G00176680 [Aldrovandia affinis]|uniref:Uncharacterized protein n=1 Tax=Aldrovandia affinis TaxID=143900 RepID=A0AAD7R096_9TELE|nr:hypothetical protein AAFF_G00176680 [Aldrovandia affinis]
MAELDWSILFPGKSELELVTVEDPEPGFQRDDAAEIADRLCMMDLLKNMLTVNPHKRISARPALHHPFLTLQHLRVEHSYHQYYKYSVQGYKEALVPYHDSVDREHVPSQETLITPRRIVPCKGSYGHSSPAPVYVDPPLCHIICQSFRITMSAWRKLGMLKTLKTWQTTWQTLTTHPVKTGFLQVSTSQI